MKFPNYSADSLNHIEPRNISTRRLVIYVGDEYYLLLSIRWNMNSPLQWGSFTWHLFWRLMFQFLGREPLVNHPPVSTIPRKYSQSCSCQEHQILPKPHLPFISFCSSFSPPIQIQETSSSRRDKTSSQFPNCFAALMAELKVIKFACKDLSRMLTEHLCFQACLAQEWWKGPWQRRRAWFEAWSFLGISTGSLWKSLEHLPAVNFHFRHP